MPAGKSLMHNESRIAGWYKSEITCGPEPKPIQTGSTLHSLAVLFGILAGYKLHARMFCGKNDGNLGRQNENCMSIQKWINLLLLMIDDYKGVGRYITMDSAYMGNIMAQVGREVWGLNMVGTVQCNRSGANTKDATKKMKKGTYESVCWQHNNKPLLFAAWGDNTVVKMLSNCHGPEILPAGDGVSRKRRGEDGKREWESTEVSCPAQTKYYCWTFHLIDKGNNAERPYDMGGKSWKHNWSPKIIFWLINMSMANAYHIYGALVTLQMPDWRCIQMKDAIKELSFVLMQQGHPMRTREASHPKAGTNLSQVLGWICGKKVRLDSKREVVAEKTLRQETWSEYKILLRMQKKNPWRSHQSVGAKGNARGKCCWRKCPGLKSSNAKRTRSHDTVITCKECSAKTGLNVWLCSGVKGGDVLPCHIDYRKFNLTKCFHLLGGGR